MPLDRTTQNNPRPPKPSLATNRTTKAPLAPRLAVVPSTPAAPASQTGRPVRANNGTAPRLALAFQDDMSSAKSTLSSNVSPRSSSRKSRIGANSASSTPTSTPLGTPLVSRPPSALESSHKEHGPASSRLGVNGANRLRAAPRQQGNHAAAPPPRPPVANVYTHAPSVAGSVKSTSSTFFHADDVRPQEQPSGPSSQRKAPVFYYANGKQDDTAQKHDAPSPPLSSLGKPSLESKFFHADSIHEARSASPALTPVSTSPEPPSVSNSALGSSLRPTSPTKDFAHLSYRKGASQVIRPALHSRNSGLSILSGPNPSSDVPDHSRRRSSAASSIMRAGHGKSASLSSIDSVVELKAAPSNDAPFVTPSPLHTEHHNTRNGTRPESVSSAPSPPLTAFSGLHSPPRTSAGGQTALEMMNELAANARRERKVLDLEISNSSLLAINRSLEKEVRKQKAELRRYRRITLSGRFSADAVDSAPESYSIAETSNTEESSEEEESGEEESDEEDSEEDSECSDSIDESMLSGSGQEERDDAHRVRDEKRLQLDLTKHHELLLDSQKMNQSLKRCLGWTEQLIKDGQKALEYKVHASDVRLGGRVLEPEDDNEAMEPAESNTLLSPWSPLHRSSDSLDLPAFNGADRVGDRDSGIDIDSLQHASLKLPDDIAPLGSPFEERLQYLYASIDALEK